MKKTASRLLRSCFDLLFWCLCFLAVFGSCHRPVETVHEPFPDPTLVSIDSLMWESPDSAFALLLDFASDPRSDSLGVFDGHYFQLLVSELLYKNDYEQTNRGELLRSVDYFDSLTGIHGGDASPAAVFLDARAHYIKGVGCYERDSVVEACAEYLKAAEVMEDRFLSFETQDIAFLQPNHVNRFMALAYTHLAALFSDHYLHAQAIYFGKLSLSYYKKYDAVFWHPVWVLIDLGAQYDMLEQLDSADYYYHQAMIAVPDTTCLTYRDIVAHQAYLRYKKEKQLDSAITQLHYLLSNAENEEEQLARCLSIAELYYSEKEYDSARFYFNQVHNKTSMVDSEILASQRLLEISNIYGDSLNAVFYSNFLSSYADAGDERGTIDSQLTKMQHDYALHKMVDGYSRQEERKLRLVKRTTMILSSCIGIFVLLFLLNRMRLKRIETDKNEIEKQLVAEKSAHKIHQSALASRLKRSNELLRNVSQQLKKAQQEKTSLPEKQETQDNFIAFMESPICKYIHETVERGHFKPKINYLLYKESALNKTQRRKLTEIANIYLGEFTIRMKSQYPALSKDDLFYCYLYLLGLEEADISALMQKAYSTVCERNRKIKRIMGTKDDLSTVLRDLINR